jgi:predicted Zn-dependent protease with MMP-like domain
MLVMLDLSAAFDTIDHTTLLHRLQHHFGIAGKPLEWVTSYLSDHYQL